MKILGVGLSRTGTSSLNEALKILGFKSIHWEQQAPIMDDIVMGVTKNPNFKLFDHVDAVVDIPAAHYYKEIYNAYPELLFILTTRNIDSWFQSVKWHYGKRTPYKMKDEQEILKKTRALQKIVYGSEQIREKLYKTKFQEHNNNVIKTIPKDKLLIMDITAGDGWEKLCSFLNIPEPSTPFPFDSKRFVIPNKIIRIKNIILRNIRRLREKY